MIRRILARLWRADAPASPREPVGKLSLPDFTSDAARRYHGSDQWGR